MIEKNKKRAPLIVDIAGVALDAQDRALLMHPLIGGVVFFSRNIASRSQLIELIASIRAIRSDLLLTVDQEGGRVQRFKTGFTPIPPMGELGVLYSNDSSAALARATDVGFTLASELREVGIDLTFAPVLDLDKGLCTVVGNRAFSDDPNVVIALAKALLAGFRQADMPAVAKHFPGHGSVRVDSHLSLPTDNRYLDEIKENDLKPFKALIEFGIDAIMPAHIVFSKIDNVPACFSSRWLQTILREQLGFKGLIFSDDMSMAGAKTMGDLVIQTQAAREAGCDYVLICNDRRGVVSLLDKSEFGQMSAAPSEQP